MIEGLQDRRDDGDSTRLLKEVSKDDCELAIKAIYQQMSRLGKIAWKEFGLHSEALLLRIVGIYINMPMTKRLIFTVMFDIWHLPPSEQLSDHYFDYGFRNG